MSWLTEKLTQTATLWKRDGIDDNGEVYYKAPITIPVRWEDEEQVIISITGEEKIAKSQVFVDQDIQEGSYLFLGTSTFDDPRDEADAREVISFSKIPDVNGERFERVVFL